MMGLTMVQRQAAASAGADNGRAAQQRTRGEVRSGIAGVAGGAA